ncbi:HemK2/MTQ2 family protein methyltransferase [Amycolatopsis suaedae]|uniref:Methyltransferase domain-containing protein n=1 Tax=Amycolatopsis suaedae TaxID=2510978 RepID=A0A4Q7IYW8_9PSEU|nr:HemK2/MTQ2 family protein methyltransferase [Amycolatopsis suaedae]RZQ60211.1 methyltransferase domain-containing protein [Amycolatopsis suaedae]
MWLLRLPGVYRPQADTRLLTGALRQACVSPGGRVLDLCTGSGAVALAAARAGAREVVAVDHCRRAVWSAAVNAAIRGLPVRARRGDLLEAVPDGRFDLVLANPPYVPCPPEPGPRRGQAWDAGPDGRLFLDPLCSGLSRMLTQRGTALIVHSALSTPERSIRQLRDSGLKASVVARAFVPFGPVNRSRVSYLEEAGYSLPGQRTEELVVIRADRTERTP